MISSILNRTMFCIVLFFCLMPAVPIESETYSLSFSSASGRMSWTPSFPSWNYTTPVAFSAVGDSTSMLRLNASASIRASVFPRDGRKNLQESGNVSTSVTYPILGPKATIGLSASMSSRSAALVKQKTRNQSINIRFGYKPLALSEGPFKNMRVNVTPGLITARRATRASLDSTIQEKGLQYTASLSVSPSWDINKKKVNTSFSLSKRDNTLKNNKNRTENVRFSTGYTLPKEVRVNFTASESRSQQGVTRAVIIEEETEDFVLRDTTVKAELSERQSQNFGTTLKAEIAGFNISARQSWSKSKNTNTANAENNSRNRFFARDRKNEKWDYDLSAKGELPANLIANTSINYETSDDRRLPVALQNGLTFRDPSDDRLDRSLYIRGSLDWQLKEDHGMTLSGSSRVIRSDNPGEPEQDRDTFSKSAALRYRGSFDSGLTLNAQVASTMTHRVNLHVSRSNQNQRTRDLRFSVNPSYERLQTTINHAFEISARRTILDFDRQLNPNELARQSNIRRGWSMRHSLRRSVTDYFKANATYTFRADDTGILLVENSAQIVDEDNADHSVTVGARYVPSEVLTIATSYSYRLDRQWKYKYASTGGMRELKRSSPHRNLAVSAEFNPRTETTMSARFSRSKQQSGTFDSVSISISRRV